MEPEKDSLSNNFEHLERDHGGKIFRLHHLSDEYKDIKKWFSNLKFGWKEIMAVIKEDRVTIKLYTPDSEIAISVRLPRDEDSGYLGGIASMRTPRPGETWTRGNDLSDGPYNEETFKKIMYDIVGWEIQPLEFDI